MEDDACAIAELADAAPAACVGREQVVITKINEIS
jgi:hypothetical protein